MECTDIFLIVTDYCMSFALYPMNYHSNYSEFAKKISRANFEMNINDIYNLSLVYNKIPICTKIFKKYFGKYILIEVSRSFEDYSLIVKELLNPKNAIKYSYLDINLQDGLRDTALMLASENNHIEIVKELIKQKDLNVDLKNICEQTAYTEAWWAKNYKIIKLFKQNGLVRKVRMYRKDRNL